MSAFGPGYQSRYDNKYIGDYLDKNITTTTIVTDFVTNINNGRIKKVTLGIYYNIEEEVITMHEDSDPFKKSYIPLFGMFINNDDDDDPSILIGEIDMKLLTIRGYIYNRLTGHKISSKISSFKLRRKHNLDDIIESVDLGMRAVFYLYLSKSEGGRRRARKSKTRTSKKPKRRTRRRS